MTGKHYATIGMLLGAIALMVAGLDHWGDAVKPQFVAGVLAAIAAVLKGMYEGSPSDGAPSIDVRKIAPVVLLAVALGAGAPLFTGCAKASPVLSPTGVSAVQATEVVHALDTVRDVAKIVSDAYPTVVTPADFQRILTAHRSIVTVIWQLPNGWKPTALAAFDEMQAHLSPSAQARLKPYLVLARVLVDAFVPAAALPDPDLPRLLAQSLAVDATL